MYVESAKQHPAVVAEQEVRQVISMFVLNNQWGCLRLQTFLADHQALIEQDRKEEPDSHDFVNSPVFLFADLAIAFFVSLI